MLYNPDFNCTEFGTIKNAAESNNFVLSMDYKFRYIVKYSHTKRRVAKAGVTERVAGAPERRGRL